MIGLGIGVKLGRSVHGASGGGGPITVASDTFTRADSATTLGSAETGQAWTSLAGTWGISANQAYNAVVGGSKYVVVDAGVSDCTVQVTLVTGGTDFGLILRAVDSNNLLRLYPESGAIQLGQYVAGSFSAIGTVGSGLTFNANGVLKVAMSGPSFTISYNGVVLGTLTTAQFQASTKHGFGNGAPQNVKFDNFSITTP